jgi:hypothetical protein
MAASLPRASLDMDAQTLSYAQRRALNIARNAERMRAIGLTTIHVAALSPPLPVHKQKRDPAPKSESRSCEEGALSGELFLRRSGRTTGVKPANMSRMASQAVPSRCLFTGTAAPSYKDNFREYPPPPLGRVRATEFKSDAPRPPAPAAAGSSRGVNCDVQKLLDSYIGQCIAPHDGQVKRAVIALSSSGSCPSFNRMSGITEWANCVFLFVNVGGSDYDNLLYFSRSTAPSVDDLVADDTGAACAVMTWFAQPRQVLAPCRATPLLSHSAQDASTPVLQRLQRSGTSPVLVFFRVVGVPEYVFGGRLQCDPPPPLAPPPPPHHRLLGPTPTNQIRCARCRSASAPILVPARGLGCATRVRGLG